MKKYDELTESDISNWLSCRLVLLEKLSVQKQNDLKKAPDGTLRIAQRHGKPQFYVKNSKSDKKEKYLSGKLLETASRLAQKDYDYKLLTILAKQIAAIKAFRKNYTAHSLSQLYEKLVPSRKKLVVPVVIPDDEFVKFWLKEKHYGKDFKDDLPGYYTQQGERVRSKSEIIIADMLFNNGIPYKYEVPVELKHFGTVYPDFTCLDLKSRKEIVWEHFGMMDDPDYVKKTLKKLQDYTESGYIIGKNLIVTFESGEVPLSTKIVKKLIEEYLF